MSDGEENSFLEEGELRLRVLIGDISFAAAELPAMTSCGWLSGRTAAALRQSL